MNLMKKTRKTKTNEAASEPVDNGFKKLKLLITVVNRKKTEFYLDYLTGFDVNLQTAVAAQGTAPSDTMYLLGLADSDKSVILSVVREDRAEEALQGLDEKFHTLRGGKGIAFTIPMTGAEHCLVAFTAHVLEHSCHDGTQIGSILVRAL